MGGLLVLLVLLAHLNRSAWMQGTLPDMHATTDLYLRLQRVYTAKAEADVDAVEQHLRAILKEAGISGSSIVRADVKLFCKNARHLRYIAGWLTGLTDEVLLCRLAKQRPMQLGFVHAHQCWSWIGEWDFHRFWRRHSGRSFRWLCYVCEVQLIGSGLQVLSDLKAGILFLSAGGLWSLSFWC